MLGKVEGASIEGTIVGTAVVRYMDGGAEIYSEVITSSMPGFIDGKLLGGATGRAVVAAIVGADVPLTNDQDPLRPVVMTAASSLLFGTRIATGITIAVMSTTVATIAIRRPFDMMLVG
jgi:hypothetical protein